MIARASPAHAEALAAIHHEAFPPGQRWGADAMVLQLELPGVFVLFDPAGAMVMARVAAGEAEILTLAVLPARRRLGLARALMQAAIAQCEALGAQALFLEVATRNQAARALYAGFGFEEVGRRRGYYADGDDALTLRRTLTPAPAGPR